MSRSLIASTAFDGSSSGIYEIAADLEIRHEMRLRRVREAWKFYKGQHWSHRRDDNEPVSTVNYCRAFVDVHVNFLMKGGFKCTIPDDPTTPNEDESSREFIRAMLEETWRRNRVNELGFEIAQTGSVSGDVFLRVSWETNDPLETPYARIDVLPSQYVFPDFAGPHGVDRKRVNSILVLYPQYADQIDNDKPLSFVNSSRSQNTKKVVLYAERWYANKVIKYMPDGTQKTEPNVLGEIPIVHIPNYPISGEYFGRSDLDGLIDLQREYNERTTDISDVVNYHGSPITIVTGAKLSNLERGANRMWGLPEGARVENLALSGELSACITYLDRIKASMHELAGIPATLLSASKDGASSAVAISMRYMPLIEKRNVKIQTYGYGLRLVNRLIMLMHEKVDPDFADRLSGLGGNKYRNDVVFADPMPRDTTLELDRSAKRLELGLSTRRLEMERMGLSQGEIDRVMRETRDDAIADAEAELEIGQKLERSGNPDPVRDNPESRGEAGSIRKEMMALDG